MAAPGLLPLPLEQGRRFRESYLISDAAGLPLTLTGTWTPYAQIRDAPGGKLLLDLSAMFTLDDGAPGRLTMDIPGSATLPLPRGGVWELVLVPLVGGIASAEPLLRGPVLLDIAVVLL